MAASTTREELANKVIDDNFVVGNNNPNNLLARQHYSQIPESLIYLNLFIQNNDEVNPFKKESTYFENRTIDLFQGKATPTNYSLSVQRATFNTESVPLFIWDADDTGMEINLTATVGGNDYISTTPIEYYNNYDLVPRNKYVYNVHQWLDIVNRACKDCYDALLSAAGLNQAAWNAAGGPPNPPIFTYDGNNNFYWKMAKQYETEDTPVNNPLLVKFWFNQLFNTKLQNGFNVKCDNTDPYPTISNEWYYELIVESDNFGNYVVVPAGTDYFLIKNCHYIYDNLIQMKKIVITTQMPIDSEFSNSFYKLVDKNGNSFGTDSPGEQSNTPIKVLLDLNVNPDMNNFSGVVTYQPQVVRYYNIAAESFKLIQFSYFWAGMDGLLHPLYIPYKQSASIKLLFSLR